MSSDSDRGGPYVGAMLRLVWQWVWEQISSGVSDAGYDDINPAHIALFRYPSLDGLRPSEVAARSQITKQSVNDLVGHLEQRGYVVRTPDPADGRARILRLTTKGHRLETTINHQAHAAELGIAEMLGPRRFATLRNSLEELTRLVENTPPA
ncbi:MAG TPA: MarR family winged helix-turn-helix transcriptional regulator [Acidimicrobiia bacterium]|nr:MarR family winged helix-turn-helix transcriptional regulator [Acidimicrobiia bacterium]